MITEPIGSPEQLKALLNIDRLVAFVVVAEKSSVHAAAKYLGLSQPAVSHRLRLLQEDLGAVLLERVGRRVQLTAAGRSALAATPDLFASLNGIVDAIRHVERDIGGRVRIGMVPTVSRYLLLRSLTKLLDERPAITLTAALALGPDLAAKLRQGELDVVVSVGATGFEGLSLEFLGTDEVVAVFPRSVSLRRGGRPNVIQALRQNRLLLWGPSRDETFDAVTSWAIAKGCVRDNTVWMPHVDSLMGMVAAGAGATLLPKYTVREAKEAGRIRLVAVPELTHTLRFFLATRHGPPPNPTLDAVLKTIRTGARLALADRKG